MISFDELKEKVQICIPVGKDFAITSKELEKLLGVSGWALRRAINELRSDGIPICSYRFGYFWANDMNDISETIKMLNHRCYKIIRAAKGLENASKILYPCNETNLQEHDNNMKVGVV